MKQSDHIIKKKILIHHFGINIMKNRKKWKNINIGEFEADFTEFCGLTKMYARNRNIAQYNWKEKFTIEVMSELKGEFNPTKKKIDWLDEEE